MIARLFALIRKEFLAVLKDPRSRVILFLPPVMQCLLFGYAASYDLSNIPYAVLDQSHAPAAVELLSHFDGSGIFRRAATLSNPAELTAAIDSRQALLAIQIPQDFERRLDAGQPAEVQLVADGRNSNTGATAMAYASTVVESFNADWRASKGITGPAVQLVARAWYNPNLETRWFMIPSLIGTLTMMAVMSLTGLSVAREREQGTFDQLLVTPYTPGEIMVGKAVPNMAIGLVQSSSILLVAQFWFRIPFAGSFVLLYLGMALFMLAAVGLGLLVSSIAETMQQALVYTFVLLMPFTLLSGLTTPFTNMPEVLQSAMIVNPLRYALDFAQRVYLEDAGFVTLLPDFVPLLVIGVLTLASASWLFRRSLN